MIGRLTLNASASHSSLLNSIENSIEGDINNLVADIAKKLNIHDFYSAHILDYCEVSPASKFPHGTKSLNDHNLGRRDSTHRGP